MGVTGDKRVEAQTQTEDSRLLEIAELKQVLDDDAFNRISEKGPVLAWADRKATEARLNELKAVQP